MTPRQTLVAHLTEYHPRVKAGHRSLIELGRMHAREHWRYGDRSHRHEGVNRGPDERPPGWRTGEGVISLTERKAADA